MMIYQNNEISQRSMMQRTERHKKSSVPYMKTPLNYVYQYEHATIIWNWNEGLPMFAAVDIDCSNEF